MNEARVDEIVAEVLADAVSEATWVSTTSRGKPVKVRVVKGQSKAIRARKKTAKGRTNRRRAASASGRSKLSGWHRKTIRVYGIKRSNTVKKGGQRYYRNRFGRMIKWRPRKQRLAAGSKSHNWKRDYAVRSFQKKHGLKVDGIVGPKTRRMMRRRGVRSFS